MAELAKSIQDEIHRPVTDATGLARQVRFHPDLRCRRAGHGQRPPGGGSQCAGESARYIQRPALAGRAAARLAQSRRSNCWSSIMRKKLPRRINAGWRRWSAPAWPARGQSPFDAASVKPANPNLPNGRIMVGMQAPAEAREAAIPAAFTIPSSACDSW